MHDPLVGVLLALTIVIGVGVLILLVMFAGLAIAAMKTRKKIHTLIQQYETQVAPQVGPMAQRARELVEDLSPKIRSLVDDLSPKIEHTERNRPCHVSGSGGHQRAHSAPRWCDRRAARRGKRALSQGKAQPPPPHRLLHV